MFPILCTPMDISCFRISSFVVELLAFPIYTSRYVTLLSGGSTVCTILTANRESGVGLEVLYVCDGDEG